jgi:hypothetical protein
MTWSEGVGGELVPSAARAFHQGAQKLAEAAVALLRLLVGGEEGHLDLLAAQHVGDERATPMWPVSKVR